MQTYGSDEDYQAWVRNYDTLDDAARTLIQRSIARLRRFPIFSILPLPGVPTEAYREGAFLDALQRQLYPHWELVLPTGKGPTRSAEDARLRNVQQAVTDVNTTEAFDTVLEAARGDYILPLPADARLAEHALYEMAVAAARDPEIDFLYADEDCIGPCGGRHNPWFKTGWDPDFLLERNSIGVPTAHRASLLRALGSLPLHAGSEAAILYALSLRTAFATSPSRIHHIPAILCHRSAPISFRDDAEEVRAVARTHLATHGIGATVESAPTASQWAWVLHNVPEPAPMVSIIIPTRDRADLLERCVASVVSNTDYPALEVLIVDNDSREPTATALLRRLSSHPVIRILPYPGNFNYAAMNNFAAREALGHTLVLLNNDTEVIGLVGCVQWWRTRYDRTSARSGRGYFTLTGECSTPAWYFNLELGRCISTVSPVARIRVQAGRSV